MKGRGREREDVFSRERTPERFSAPFHRVPVGLKKSNNDPTELPPAPVFDARSVHFIHVHGAWSFEINAWRFHVCVGPAPRSRTVHSRSSPHLTTGSQHATKSNSRTGHLGPDGRHGCDGSAAGELGAHSLKPRAVAREGRTRSLGGEATRHGCRE